MKIHMKDVKGKTRKTLLKRVIDFMILPQEDFIMHSEKDRLELASVLTKQIIEYNNHCKHKEFESEEVRCEHWAQIMSLAEQFASDEKILETDNLTSEFLDESRN